MSRKEEEQFQVQFRLSSFRILRFNYAEPEDENLDFKPEDCLFHFSSKILVNFKNRAIGIRLLTKMNHKKGLNIGEVEIESTFDILGFEKLLQTKDGVVLPDDFVASLISITYSTTRGAILGKGSGTILEKFILPLIDPKKLLPKEKEKQKTETKTSSK